MNTSKYIGSMHWDACKDCAMLDDETGDCPMDGLDLIIKGDSLVCNLHVRKKI